MRDVILLVLVQADGAHEIHLDFVSDDEAAQIRAYAKEKRSLDDIPITDLSTEDRRVLVQHAVLLTYVDGEQAESERLFIEALCEKLRIPADEARSIIEAAAMRARRFLNLL